MMAIGMNIHRYSSFVDVKSSVCPVAVCLLLCCDTFLCVHKSTLFNIIRASKLSMSHHNKTGT